MGVIWTILSFVAVWTFMSFLAVSAFALILHVMGSLFGGGGRVSDTGEGLRHHQGNKETE